MSPINLDFLIIIRCFADKLDEVNCAFENIAQKLKSHKKVIAIDYTGNLNIKNAKRIKAIKDFKLPLDFYSLDCIWEKALGHAPLDVQTELEDTFIELKEFVKQILDSKGLTYKDFGTCSTESCDYPDYAHPLAEAVETGEVYPRNSYLRIWKWNNHDTQ